MNTKYRYTECGLDNIYLVNGYEITSTPDGDEISIHDIHNLHRAIGLYLVSKPSRLTGKEIRFIRHYLDLSQQRFAEHLGMNYQSVLGWEKGKTKIQKTTERLMRASLFSYLNPDDNSSVYDKINEMAELDQHNIQQTQEILFQEISDEWKRLAA